MRTSACSPAADPASIRIGAEAELERIGIDLLRPLFPPPLGVRLLGVSLSNLGAAAAGGGTQLALRLGRGGPGPVQ